MSARRNTGRDRRFGGALPFSLGNFIGDGLTNWWDAAVGITIATGVSNWTDLVGGKNLSQGTGAAQPNYVTSATPAGTPAVDCDTSSKIIQNTSMTSQANAAYTWIGVIKLGASSNAWWLHTDAGATVGSRQDSNTTKYQWVSLPATVYTGSAWDSAYHVVIWRVRASGGFGTAIDTMELYVDGVSRTVTGGPSNFTQGTTLFRFGNALAAPKIAEAAIANGSLISGARCQQIYAGLKAKHGTP